MNDNANQFKMKEILRRTAEIKDIALSRADAMDRCINLGKKFIERFDKIYTTSDETNKNHWAEEMSGWLKSVRQIKLNNTNDYILDGDLRDWFFTAGANPQDFMKNASYEELKTYDLFVNKLVNKQDLQTALGSIKLSDSAIKNDRLSPRTFKKLKK